MTVTQKVYEELSQTFCAAAAEMGGMLGFSPKGIVSFYFDKNGIGKVGSYEPDIETLNQILEEWNKQRILFAGLVHTHRKNKKPSLSDLNYGERLVDAFNRAIILGIFVVEMQTLFLYRIDKKNGKRFVKKLNYYIGRDKAEIAFEKY